MPATFRHRLPQLASRLAVLGAVTFVSACGATKEPPKFCPRLGLLDNADELTRFQGNGRDITDITLSGSIDKVPATCVQGNESNSVASDLTIQSTFTHGAGARSRTDQVTYVVTVLDGDTIIEQHDFPLVITFPEHVDRASFATAPIHLAFPAPASGKANYRVFVSFRLTPAELEYNRTHPTR